MKIYKTNKRKFSFTTLPPEIYKVSRQNNSLGSHTRISKQLTQRNAQFLKQLGLKVRQ